MWPLNCLAPSPKPRLCKKSLSRRTLSPINLPPLFPYVRLRGDRTEWFEDGGVVDNLPVWFGTHLESCDLLFILPLNASFAEPVDHTSISRRLFRVMDVRQGVLERNSLKLAYLYNELAAAQNAISSADAGGAEHHTTAIRARISARKTKPVSVFAICPDQPLVIGTAELWKSAAAGEAFDLMYASTKYELKQNFNDLVDPNWIRLALVRPEGQRVYVDNF